jgi:hypothetical protein
MALGCSAKASAVMSAFGGIVLQNSDVLPTGCQLYFFAVACFGAATLAPQLHFRPNLMTGEWRRWRLID